MNGNEVTVFNVRLLAIIVVVLFVILLAVSCIVRKVPFSPWPCWVMSLGFCVVSVTMAILGNEPTVGECLVFSAISFCAGCLAEVFKK